MSQEERVFEVQLETLKAELPHVDGAIRQHDEITTSIKNWAMVTWTAGVGFVLQDEN